MSTPDHPPSEQPAQPPGTAARKRRLPTWGIVAIVLGGVMALCCIGGGVTLLALASTDGEQSSSSNSVETSPPSGEATEPEQDATTDEADEENGADNAESAGIGDTVADGQFAFTVTDVETGIERVGDEFLGEDAQGQFVFIHVTVENVGDEARRFDSSSQYLYDAEGRQHSADGGASLLLDESESFLNEINPGNSVDAIVVFDVPTDVTLATVELHDSPFSGGVQVTLE